MIFKHSSYSFLLLVFLTVSAPVDAQNSVFDNLRKQFPDESLCYLNNEIHYEITWNKGAIKILKHVTEERMVLIGEKVGSTLKDNVYLNGFMPLKSIKAQTITAKGKKIAIKDFKESNTSSGSSFYDDSKEISFYFTDLEAGATTKLEYTLEITTPELLPFIVLQNSHPVKNFKVKITYPKEVEVGFTTYKLPQEKTTFYTSNSGKLNKLEWQFSDLEDIKIEYKMPSYLSLISQIHPFVKSMINPEGKTIQVMGSAELLHAWYRKIMKENSLKHEDRDQIQTILDSILSADQAEIDKVRTVFQWVQKNIKYIAFEYELGGFVPRPPQMVCERRFGDCKDMAALIHEMLKLAGVKSYLTWVGTRRIPLKYSELGTPSVDNHMITTYFDANKKPYFLDATHQFLIFGQTPYHLQGKEVMISYSDTTFELMTVPTDSSELNQLYDSCYLRIKSDNTLAGNGLYAVTGNFLSDELYDIASYRDDELHKYAKNTVSKGSNKFKLTSHNISNKNNVNEPFKITYDFELPDYFVFLKDKMYCNLNLFKDQMTESIKDRKHPIEDDYQYEAKLIAVLELPDTHKLAYLPEKTAKKMNGFGYEIAYEVHENLIVYKLKVVSSQLLLKPEFFDEWNTLCDEMGQNFNESIVLIKN